jgi:outer membrane protein assembly factor BamB
MRLNRSRALPVFLASCLFVCACSDDDDDARQTGALVVTSDFQSGSLSSVDLDTRAVSRNIGTAHSDAGCRVRDGRVWIVNRLGQDNLTELDPSGGYRVVRQFSTGPGSNPQDVCLARGKAYVPLYGEAAVAVLDPETGASRGRVDLSPLSDADGLPEAAACAAVGDRVYVTLQSLVNFTPAGPGRIAILDARTDTLVRAEPLTGTNPFTALVHDAARERLLVGSSGFFGVLDGGIESFDLRTERAAGFVVTEQALGGDVSGFALFRADRAFALISDAAFATKVVAFDPQTGARLSVVFDSTDDDPSDSDFDLSAVAVNDRGELYVADGNFTAPGLRIFDAASGQALVASPIDVGLPPRDICFAAQ